MTAASIPPDPADGAPRRRRAARAVAPGGPATSPAPTGVAGGKTPAGAGDDASPPAGTTSSAAAPGAAAEGGPEPGRGGGTLRPGQGARPALRGAEWRAAAAKAGRRRPAKATPRAAAKAPAIPPPPASGASLTASARCLSGCGWTAGPGDPGEVDKAAAAHAEKPPKHATNLFSEPAAGAA